MYCVCILTFTVPISLVWRAAKKKKKKIIISVCLINGCICMYVCMHVCMHAIRLRGKDQRSCQEHVWPDEFVEGITNHQYNKQTRILSLVDLTFIPHTAVARDKNHQDVRLQLSLTSPQPIPTSGQIRKPPTIFHLS